MRYHYRWCQHQRRVLVFALYLDRRKETTTCDKSPLVVVQRIWCSHLVLMLTLIINPGFRHGHHGFGVYSCFQNDRHLVEGKIGLIVWLWMCM